MNFTIETDRLLLRPLTLADLPALLAIRGKEEVSRYLGTSAVQTPEFVEARVHVYLECQRRYGYGMSAATDKSSGEFVGWGGLQPLEFGWNGVRSPQAEKEVEIGYGFDRPHWGKGYATEVAAAWLRFGFEEAKLPRIIAVASPENKASWHVMEKLGMKYETTGQYYGTRCVCYAIARDEFVPRGSYKLLTNS